MFKRKCPSCGVKNDRERQTCIECGLPFGSKEVKKGVSFESSEPIEQLKKKAEEETVPDALQDEMRSTEEIETPEFIKDETPSLKEEEADILNETLKQCWVKANGRCQCLKAYHGHDIPCGKKLRVDAYKLAAEGGWVYCDLYSFPFDKSDEITVPAIVCWECYNWKPDFNWEKFQSTHVT